MNFDLRKFLHNHVHQSDSKSPEAIKAKLLRWIEIANNPKLDTTDHSEVSLRYVRRRAVQNVKRLATNHPLIADQIDRERQTQLESRQPEAA